MKRRLLILFTLLAFLGVLRYENVVHAEDCGACGPNWNTCVAQAESALFTCNWAAEDAYNLCMADGNPQYVCVWGQFAAEMACDTTHDNAVNSCTNAYNLCLMTCDGGGGSGGGGGTQSCVSPAMGNGYSAMCVDQYGSMLNSCIENGATAFDGWNVDTSGLENCLANSSPSDCCRDQISIIIQARCGCNRHPQNPDCKTCYSF
jgi:hypothetical protein